MKVKTGDIFQTNPIEGRYGAIQVLIANGHLDGFEGLFHLIAVSQYFSERKPANDDILTSEILIEKRFFFRNQPCIKIYQDPIPESMIWVSNRPVEEKYQLELGYNQPGKYALAGKVPKDIGYNAFLEWRWEHDREAFEQEQAEEKLKLEERLKSKR